MGDIGNEGGNVDKLEKQWWEEKSDLARAVQRDNWKLVQRGPNGDSSTQVLNTVTHPALVRFSSSLWSPYELGMNADRGSNDCHLVLGKGPGLFGADDQGIVGVR